MLNYVAMQIMVCNCTLVFDIEFYNYIPIGIIDKMQHFVDINVQGIILSSFYLSHTQNLDPANPDPDFGYEVIDHKDIDPIYGTLEDVDELIAVAHDKG